MVKWLIRAILGVIALAALIAIGGYFALKRDAIPFDALAAKYESAASRYAELPNGIRMHYRDEGNPNGPTLLLVHGFAASLHTWEPWVARLGDAYHIVSLDLPGHGLTSAPADYHPSMQGYADDVAAFAQTQDLRHFAIAGSSMGGHVAWEYALAHSEQIDALLLVDSAGWPDTSASAESKPLIFRLLRSPLAPLLRDLDTTRLTRAGLVDAFPAQPALVDAAMVARYTELARGPGHREILLRLMTSTPSIATPERLAALAMPVLILHGTRDTLVTVDHATLFKQSIPHAQLTLFDGVGHVPQEEIADNSAAVARVFLAGSANGAAGAAQ